MAQIDLLEVSGSAWTMKFGGETRTGTDLADLSTAVTALIANGVIAPGGPVVMRRDEHPGGWAKYPLTNAALGSMYR
jgi:hypothetical protein